MQQADIHSLLGMSSGRYVPFMTRVIVFFATIAVWMPLVNLLLVWAAWKDRALMPPSWLKWVKSLIWAALALNVALVLIMAVEPYFRGPPNY